MGPDINGEASFDLFGWSLAMSGDGTIIAAGALLNDGNGTKSGQVRVFEKDPSDQSYIQIGYHFGFFIDHVRGWYNIGAIQNNGNGIYSGHVRVYQRVAAAQSYQHAIKYTNKLDWILKAKFREIYLDGRWQCRPMVQLLRLVRFIVVAMVLIPARFTYSKVNHSIKRINILNLISEWCLYWMT